MVAAHFGLQREGLTRYNGVAVSRNAANQIRGLQSGEVRDLAVSPEGSYGYLPVKYGFDQSSQSFVVAEELAFLPLLTR